MTDSSSSPSPKKGGISCLGWFLIGSFAFFAVAMAIVAILPDNEERASTPSFRSTAATSTPRPASTRAPATPAIQASNPCPADSSEELDTYAVIASLLIEEESGKKIPPATVRREALSAASLLDLNGGSCVEVFDLVVQYYTS